MRIPLHVGRATAPGANATDSAKASKDVRNVPLSCKPAPLSDVGFHQFDETVLNRVVFRAHLRRLQTDAFCGRHAGVRFEKKLANHHNKG